MKHLELANQLALLVAKMANGNLKGFSLEGAVSHIEKALDQVRLDTLDEAAAVSSWFTNTNESVEAIKRLKDREL